MNAFVVIASLTARALLGRRRTLLMLLLAGTPIALGLLVRLNDAELNRIGPTIDGFVFRVVLPLVSLVFGTAALGSELDDGTAIHILTKPVSRWTIIAAKLAVAGTLTAGLVVPSTLIAGVLLGGFGSDNLAETVAFGIASLIGSFLYVAIFLVLSVATSRGLIVGLAYSLIWEAVLSDILPGSQIFSVREYVGGIAEAIAPGAAPESVIGAGGFLYAGAALVIAIALGSVRLSTYEIRGSD